MSDDSLLSPKDASSNSTRLKVKRRSRRRRDASGGAAPASHNDNLIRRTSSNSSASKISTNSQRENPRDKLFLAEDIPLLSDVPAALAEKFNQLELTASGMACHGWQFVCEENGVTVTRTGETASAGFTVTRGTVHIHFAPNDIYELVANVPLYTRWVEQITISDCKRKISAASSYNHLEFAGYWPVSGREVYFVQHAARKKDGTVLVLWSSDSIAEKSFPMKKGTVRADVGPSGFVIQPLDKSVTGQGKTISLVSCVLQFNMKGWIPASYADSVSTVQHFLLSAVMDALENPNLPVRRRSVDMIPPTEEQLLLLQHELLELRDQLIKRRNALQANEEALVEKFAGRPKTAEELDLLTDVGCELSEVLIELQTVEASLDTAQSKQ
mmetsp:Transcript_1833/g.3034  ORF Transcript_1833/g.3034 Transcript_1833/m.3034 type:complete len:385 (+) Transcript_1833:6-1160(+)